MHGAAAALLAVPVSALPVTAVPVIAVAVATAWRALTEALSAVATGAGVYPQPTGRIK